MTEKPAKRASRVALLEGVDVMAAVVDARSFGGAAEALDMSQPGVSRAVARLEARLGIRIFERTTRAVRLTEEGRRYYDQVMPLLAALDEATDAARHGAVAVRGRLRVNVDALFSYLNLGTKLGAWLDSHPALALELVTRDALGDMVGEGFDLAVRFGHPPPSSLVARKLLDTRIVTVATPAYLKRHGHPTDPRALADPAHRCLQFRDPTTARPFPWEFHRGRKKIVVETHGQLTVNEAGTYQSLCLAGIGVAQMFALAADDLIAQKKLVRLFPDWPDEKFPLYAYHPSRHHVPAKTRALLDFIAGLVA
ncbi:MAG: LysR family transcriptional regulator [Rhodoferax sp.]|nr:LysR family transcriptional regulator [Rhodoferax sp.]